MTVIVWNDRPSDWCLCCTVTAEVTAFSVYEFLLLPLDAGLTRDINTTALPQALYDVERGGAPKASAMMAHFALLFAMLRWWKPVDPLRRTRLSLWSVAVAVVAGWAVHQVLPIPQPYGMLIAGGIAIAVQMSAPWIDPRAKPDARRIQPNRPASPYESPGAPGDLSPRSIT